VAARGRLIVVYWMPAVLWAGVILGASSDLFSGAHSAGWLSKFIPPSVVPLVNFLLRKAAHLTEYFILGALLFRAARGEAGGWRGRWAATALLLALAVAVTDEWHQTFVPSRTASPWDVLLDMAGATLALLVGRASARRMTG
jgi:VanZ family protein